MSLFSVLPATAQTGLTASSSSVVTAELSTAWSEQAWIAGMEAEVSGNAGDDVFIAAANRAGVEGVFSNSLAVIASEVDVRGSVGDHLRVAAVEARIDADIGNSLSAAAMQGLHVSTGSVVRGAVYAAAQSVTALGRVEGPVRVLARKATLGGDIGGTVHLAADDIVILPHTRIAGDLVYLTTNRDLVLAPTVLVAGEVRRGEMPTAPALSWRNLLLLRAAFFASALLVGIPFLLVFPHTVSRAVHLARTQVLHCGFIGSISALVVPMAVLVALMSVLGIPLAIVLGTAYALVLYLSRFVVAVVIGAALLKHQGQVSAFSAVLALVVGLAVFYAVGVVPVAGPTLGLLLTLYGTGSLLLAMARPRTIAVLAPPEQQVSEGGDTPREQT